MKKIYFFINDNLLLITFLTSVFLIKLPPFYLPPFTSDVATTHVLAKILIFILMGIMLIRDGKIKINSVFVLVILFFLSQSLSIITATNVSFFIKNYQNLVAAILFFVLSYKYFVKKENKVIIFDFIYYCGVIVTILDLIFVFFSDSVSNFIAKYVQSDMLVLYLNNQSLGKPNSYMSPEIFLPLFIFITIYFYKNKNRKKFLFNITFIIIIIILAFMSGFRTRIAQVAVSLLGVFFVFIWQKREINFSKLINIFSFIIIISLTLGIFVNSRLFFNTIDRVLLKNKQLDLETINYRINSFYKSFDIFISSPVLGVGLGNYKNYISLNKGAGITSQSDKINFINTLGDPHSMISETLSETGIVGAIFFALLSIKLLFNDISYVKKIKIELNKYYSSDNILIPASIISSWTIFTYGLFNPFNSIFIYGWFWFLRGLIEGLSYEIKK